MPLTFCHPAAVLPLRRAGGLHLPAMAGCVLFITLFLSHALFRAWKEREAGH